MTQLDERNGWHVVAEGDVPDTTRDVWIMGKYMLHVGPTSLDYIGWHNSNGWFNSFTRDGLYEPPVLWHEIELPHVPIDLAEESVAVMPL